LLNELDQDASAASTAPKGGLSRFAKTFRWVETWAWEHRTSQFDWPKTLVFEQYKCIALSWWNFDIVEVIKDIRYKFYSLVS
jgi:hypothetical protein